MQLCLYDPDMYRTHRPATADAFFGRRQEMARLREMVERLRSGSPTWLAVIGPRKVGKTSLILELQRTMRAADVAFVVIDAEVERPLSPEIFRTYALRAADALLGDSLPASLEVAALSGGDYLGLLYRSAAVRGLSEDLQGLLRSLGQMAMAPAFVRLCLDIPERLARELGTWVVVAFDEFQELATLAGKRQGDPYPVLRSA